MGLQFFDIWPVYCASKSVAKLLIPIFVILLFRMSIFT